ncbi:GcrY protein [Corynebacterium sp. NML98-0116]|uniref:DNA methyltransferase n=1 Tax=Corynebacterium sp. NML98-0116 TaxID=702967 RepID=UPI000878EA38|nr:DNA methyltransferase [Corynebacterium sp. NML98-0116]AOX06050.1 GcrY protein [Corynebacterium sp. NML98-0116]
MSSVTTAPRLDRATMRRNLDAFKLRWNERLDGWRSLDEGALERKYAQSYWAELLACFGITASRMDLFEQDAKRASSGQRGYIDLFWPGVVIGEAKKPGVDLQVAIDQARDYLLGGTVNDAEQPRYIIATDFYRIRLMRLGDPETRFNIEFPLEEITDHVDELKFLAGYEDKLTHVEQTQASIAASKIMANLFTAMVGDDVDEAVGDAAPTNMQDEELAVQETSMFLTRLLFLLFGDDAGLWEQDLFYRFILEHTNSENLGTQLAGLFEVLNTPEERRRRVPDSMAAFPYVNGALFETMMPTQFFTPEMRDAILVACRFQWTNISPAIFGSLFQLVKSKEARRDDGEHYTSEKNILKTLGPLFLDELREEADRLINSKSTSVKKLREFRDSLATHVFMDPACGSGNFLIVAYRELRKIETDVIVAIREREGNTAMSLDITWEQKLSIGQFYGIELNWWPARIAETAMFLVDHQANRELADRVGLAPERLPITITAHITHGNALRLDWKALLPSDASHTYVFGNPPFLGDHTRDKEQLEDLRNAWGGIKTSRLDFVTAWHAKTLDLLEKRPGSFAFVTTNSITQGDQPARLFQPFFDAHWRIRFAHRTFTWDSEAPGKAAVHCVIIGFDREESPRPRLWDYEREKGDPIAVPVTRAINAYLVDGSNVLVGKRSQPLSPVLPEVVKGSMATDGGNFVVTEDDYEQVTADTHAVKYLRPYVGAKELINNHPRWCLWLTQLDPLDFEKSPELQRRVDAVAAERAKSKAKTTREYPHHHLFRQLGFESDVPFVAIPEVSSQNRRYLPVAMMAPGTIISNKVYGAVDPSGFIFAIASSSMFITWMKTVGGRLKSDISFSSTITWNNFPLPGLDETEKNRIADAGKKVLTARSEFPDRSLAQLYSASIMEPKLVKAHDALNREVDKAFGALRKLTTERQRQELLFANYAKLTNN